MDISFSVTCRLCNKQLSSVQEFQSHGIEECIPKIMKYFGLGELADVKSLLDMSKQFRSMEDKVNSLTTQLEKKKRKINQLHDNTLSQSISLSSPQSLLNSPTLLSSSSTSFYDSYAQPIKVKPEK
ncbi:hypothetical protein PPL_01172 [Heterostelium album PN500]|uniref:Uncharacterized protein n=1 Tax=Heterostelium pallidum (strain ATCC 26659 / Pp 5 / PN500) TaxID=670386 RepID=D3AYB2_HETP5|nr:hypothetical protein PPL_01172 [Heterostelium album PN500]EFA85939.1 hypothetical protein PPL_01172 [Heterostelium album PN500]|eukprot:XP_020438045.1 hypothetical protein PPL_01172 [Heterostelium album PN500]